MRAAPPSGALSKMQGEDDVDQFETPVGATWRTGAKRNAFVHLEKCLDSSGDGF